MHSADRGKLVHHGAADVQGNKNNAEAFKCLFECLPEISIHWDRYSYFSQRFFEHKYLYFIVLFSKPLYSTSGKNLFRLKKYIFGVSKEFLNSTRIFQLSRLLVWGECLAKISSRWRYQYTGYLHFQKVMCPWFKNKKNVEYIGGIRGRRECISHSSA